MTKQEIKSENSVASSVISSNFNMLFPNITHPSDLKEQVIRYLNVFTQILAVTAFFNSHIPTFTEFNRFHRAANSVGISILSLAELNMFCKIMFLEYQVCMVSQSDCLEVLLSLPKKQNS